MNIRMAHGDLVHAWALAIVLSTPTAFAQENIDKVNGSITASAGQAYGELETVNGNIQIESGVRAETVATVNGSIRVGDDARVDGLETVNGGIRTGKRLRSSGSIETVNGNIFIDAGGSIQDVSTVNGSIGLINTDLSGDIETVNGDITVAAGSHVKGGIKVEKPSSNWAESIASQRKPPRIIVGPNAVVEGALVFEREVKLYLHDSAKTGPITGAAVVRYSGPHAPAD